MENYDTDDDVAMDYICQGIFPDEFVGTATDWLIELLGHDQSMGMMVLNCMIHDNRISINKNQVFNHINSLLRNGSFDSSADTISPFATDFIAAIYSLFELVPERKNELTQFQDWPTFHVNQESKLRLACLDFVIKDESDNPEINHPPNIWHNLSNFDDEIKSKLLMKEEVRYSLESSIQIELQHLSESNSGSPEHLLNHLNSLYLMIDWEQTDYLSTTCLGGYLETLGQAYFLLARYMGHDHDMHDCFEKSRIFLWAAQDVVEESEDGHMLTIRAMLNPSFQNLPWDKLSLQQSKQILDYIDSLIGGGHIE